MNSMSEATSTTHLPDPGGVAGQERLADPLLTRDDPSADVCDLVATLALHLYRSSLGPTPGARELFERMTHPQPGDLVVVHDSIGHRDPDTRYRGVGYLVDNRSEWATSTAQWEREKAEDPDAFAEGYLERLVERDAYYVQYGWEPGDVCRWTNCQVLAVPKPGDRWGW